MNILEAIADPSLFGTRFQAPSFARWRVFMAALFGLPLAADELAVYRYHTGRNEPPLDGAFRQSAVIVGRRGGKSQVLALVAVYLAVFRSYAEFLAPGEAAVIAVIAADRRQARVILRYCLGLLRANVLFARMIVRDDPESIELENGVVLEIHTCRISSPRGRTFAAVLCDETAFWQTDGDAYNADEDVINALRPGLATIPGSMMLIASSPYARRGALWKLFHKHHGKDGARVLVWKASSLEMNPDLDPEVVAEAYEDDPAAAAAEYGAEFRTDIETFIAREVVDAATVPGRHELPYVRGTSYVAFADPSGGSSDSYVVAVAHIEGENYDHAVLDAIRERRPPFSPEEVTKEFAALLSNYEIGTVEGDRYGGEFPRELFRNAGITYEPAEKPASDIYKEILPSLNSGKIELLDHPRLTAQLCGLERRTARGGRDQISHPPSGHDDVINAAAGALLRALTGANGMSIWERLAD